MNAQQLQQAIQALEHDPEALRIRKVLYATAAHKWSNDSSYLEKLPFQKLILANLKQYPQAPLLQAALQQLLTGINKPTVYQPIEQRILDCLLPLYGQAINVPPVVAPKPEPAPPPAALPATLWFDLRLEVTRYTSPLRVKVLVFATLYHQPALTRPEDWQELRTFVLTDLLANLFVQYPTYPQVKERVMRVASGLEPAQDYLAAADRLLRALQPVYDRYGTQLTTATLSPPTTVLHPPGLAQSGLTGEEEATQVATPAQRYPR